MAQHMGLPWRIERQDSLGLSVIHSADGDTCLDAVCEVPDGPFGHGRREAQANAAFIVRACNSHDELVDAAKALDCPELFSILAEGFGDARAAQLCNGLRAAISKAQGTQP